MSTSSGESEMGAQSNHKNANNNNANTEKVWATNKTVANEDKASLDVNEEVTAEVRVANWRKYLNWLIAAEVSSLTRYCTKVISVKPRESDSGLLLKEIDCPKKEVWKSFPSSDNEIAFSEFEAFLFNGSFNHEHDIEGILRETARWISRSGRVVAVAYNPYLRWVYSLANQFGIRKGEQPSTFVTTTDLNNIAKLSGFEVVRTRHVGFCPWELFGVGTWINKILPAIPIIRWLSLASVITLRPLIKSPTKPSLSVVIPARNERGNIEAALQRMPDFGAPIEIIFVEGHSSDGTWEEIQRVATAYGGKFKIKCFQQTGKGKADAVRLGFSHASCDLLTILDADLTMPPELLVRFYDAWERGLGDFVNGNRLVYPMEGEAMKFLNWLGNVFFAKALSAVLGTDLGDSLCGTKLMTRADYSRFIAWRGDFGDFDPFGDFELIFPATILGLGVVEIPIRYRDRVYGSTSIRRFYHGWMLLRMTAIGFAKIKLGKTPKGKSPNC